MSILKNAVDAIILAAEDYQMKEPRRVPSCVRNLYAGVLLLFKEKLSRKSPQGSDDVLVLSRIAPVVVKGEITWKGQGKITVNVREIQERFGSLGIHVDWKRLEKIRDYRNDIEHYFSKDSHESVKTYICDCFVIIRDFVRSQLQEDPRTLLQDAWEVLVTVEEVYEKEKKECLASIKSVDWEYEALTEAITEARCTDCHSGLIALRTPSVDRDDAEFVCQVCGKSWEFEAMAETALSEYYWHANYLSYKERGDPAIVQCPFCFHETYHVVENVCFVCGEEAERECQRCRIEIMPEELDDSGFCQWCLHMMAKDD